MMPDIYTRGDAGARLMESVWAAAFVAALNKGLSPAKAVAAANAARDAALGEWRKAWDARIRRRAQEDDQHELLAWRER
jgi:fructoselysine-6-P-deglycase FrlB-like protein